MNTGEILRECAYRIGQPGGWTQKIAYRNTKNGRAFCAMGMIHNVCERSSAAYPCIITLSRTISNSKTPANSIMRWNDNRERTQEEVVKAFLDAAELWDSEHTEELIHEEVLI